MKGYLIERDTSVFKLETSNPLHFVILRDIRFLTKKIIPTLLLFFTLLKLANNFENKVIFSDKNINPFIHSL